MAGTDLTPAAPFLRRLKAYLDERFPLAGHGMLIVSYYSSNQFLARAFNEPGAPMHYSLSSLTGAIALFCIFFHLRVFDEHKDDAEDRRHYPDRVLSRGLITLTDLKRLGAVAIAIEITLGAFAGPPALVAILVALGFSLLMLKEFFISAWLKRHFIAYALSHMLIMPLLAMVVYGFAAGRYLWTAPAWFWLYAFVGFFVTLNWEISRKIRVPADEIAGVDSYSKIFGPLGASKLVLLIRVIDTGMVAAVGWHIGLASWFYVALAALYFLCVHGHYGFRKAPSPSTAKRLEKIAGLYIIAFDLILAVAMIAKFGITI